MTIKVKGYDINPITVRDSFYRRAIKFQNDIISSLKKVGVDEDSIEIEVLRAAMKNEPAVVEWYMEGYNMHYSYKLRPKYVENLYIVSKVIENQVNALLSEEIEMHDFLNSFSEDDDVHEERKNAREVLGLSHDENDMDVINKAYKDLAKQHHPDMENGSVDKFKEINKAHKVIKRELM